MSLIRTLKCTVCSNHFETEKPNNKYCSDECRKQGRRNKRKKWEQETNYAEKQRTEKALKRQRDKEVQTAEKLERIRLKKAEAERKNAERKEISRKELIEKIKQGDPLARMKLAKPNSKEYWEAYQQYELEQVRSQPKQTVLVNGISIYEDNFSEKVIDSIAVTGKILSRLTSKADR
ncbi:hypothetical protein ACEN32_06850 [Marinilactibacillus psychrotolerans]|uniref:hypothetical protein n=1 Tax=Marinilactibacillus psychrotolerans TaxID=191770 RepID=UPI00388458B6